MKKKKQTTRLIKVECPACGYIIRVTRSWLLVGVPYCPIDVIPMVTKEPSDVQP